MTEMKKDILYNSDCVEGMRQLPDECIDLVVTDCPYKICHSGTCGTGGILGNDNKDVFDGSIFAYNDIAFSEYLPELYRVLKPNTHCYIMINALNLKDLQQAAEDAGFRLQNILAWKKNNATPNHFYMQCLEYILMFRKGMARDINDMGMTNCLSVPNITSKGANGEHPTAKPVALMEVLIKQSSNAGDLILEPFAGGGSTLVAAKHCGRHYIGYEIDEKYYNLALKKLNQEYQTTLF